MWTLFRHGGSNANIGLQLRDKKTQTKQTVDTNGRWSHGTWRRRRRRRTIDGPLSGTVNGITDYNNELQIRTIPVPSLPRAFTAVAAAAAVADDDDDDVADDSIVRWITSV